MDRILPQRPMDRESGMESTGKWLICRFFLIEKQLRLCFVGSHID